uniref:Uncharacterized protein n=1 Tax=Leptospirillum ferrodiazotrophum TaxID=412449 RepID=C6HTQ3_9BACT|nr:MAG: hypothetical protein UBAL3_24060035a [Leptospirillum ferrodiazotrophum]
MPRPCLTLPLSGRRGASPPRHPACGAADDTNGASMVALRRLFRVDDLTPNPPANITDRSGRGVNPRPQMRVPRIGPPRRQLRKPSPSPVWSKGPTRSSPLSCVFLTTYRCADRLVACFPPRRKR